MGLSGLWHEADSASFEGAGLVGGGVRKLLLGLLLVSVVLAAGPVYAGSGDVGLSFSWAFFLKAPYSAPRTMLFDTPEPVANGDLLKIFVRLQNSSYVYLLLYDSRRDLYLVFPPNPDFYAGEFPAWQDFNIPADQGWLELEGINGRETFYLLAAAERQLKLERLIAAFLEDKDSQAGKDQLLAYVRRQVESAPLSGDISEAPIAIPAILRGNQGWLDDAWANIVAIRVDAGRSYSRILELTAEGGTSGDEPGQ